MADEIVAWLKQEVSLSKDKKYRHLFLAELPARRDQAVEALRDAVEDAYSDARTHIRKVMGISLDPLGKQAKDDIAAGFPGALTMNTRKGHFGELMAGLIAERFDPLGHSGWKVPAHLFRFHRTALHSLQRAQQTGGKPKHVVGRPGDDCLAFILTKDGTVSKCLVCEGKCTDDHDSGLLNDAHTGLGVAGVPVPVSVAEVIEILLDKEQDEDTRRWIEALRRLLVAPAGNAYERCDMVCYVCGRRPVRVVSWIPKAKPHPKYQSRRRLEAVEVHLEKVEELVEDVYSSDTTGGVA